MKKLTITICLLFTLLFVAGCANEAPVPVTTMPPDTTNVPTTAVPTTVPEPTEPALYTPAEGSILNKIPYYGYAGAAKIRTLSHDGTYAKQATLSDTVTTKDMLGGGEMLMFSNVKDDQGLIAYRDALASWGYTLYAENVMLKCQYDTWVSDDTVVTLMYMPGYKRLHIIAEPMRALPARQQENQYTDLGIENKIIMISCHFMNQHNGACSVFQLCDGSFLIVDSGQGWHQRNTEKYKDHYQNNAKEIYHVLEQYSPDRDGDGDKDKDDIVIAAWFFTHPHMDHMGGYPIFAQLFADKVTLEQVVFNLPNEEITEHFTDGYLAASGDKEITGEYVELLETFTTEYFPTARLVEAHPGQVYYIRDAVIEMLYTWELDWKMPNRCNSLSLVFTVALGDTKIMVPGDCGESATKIIQKLYKSYLRSDIMFVVHHGYPGASEVLNSLIGADVVLWSTTDSHYEQVKNAGYNLPLQRADATYVAGNRVTVITLPYLGEESVSASPASQPFLQP